MKIFKSSDEISIKIDDVVVKVSPLTYEHKLEVQDYMLDAAKGDFKAGMEGAKLAIKYAVKGMSGVELADGTPYELEFENDGLSNECIGDLINSEMSNKLTIICCSLLTGIASNFIDPNTGKKLEGVSIVKNSKRAQKKK